ncbi:hypothetical protein Tco_0231143 [Tanacetum coccineum]
MHTRHPVTKRVGTSRWNEFGTNIASAVICLAKKQKFNFSKLIFDVFNDEYVVPSHTKKLEIQAVEGESLRKPSKPQHTPTTASPSHIAPIPTIASSSHPKRTYKRRKTKRKATEISQSSGPTSLVADETVNEERGDSMERAATTAISLDAEHDSGNIIRTQYIATLNEPIP